MESLLMPGLIVAGALILGKIMFGGAAAGRGSDNQQADQQQSEPPRYRQGRWSDQYEATREERFSTREGLSIGTKIVLALVIGFVLAVVLLALMGGGAGR